MGLHSTAPAESGTNQTPVAESTEPTYRVYGFGYNDNGQGISESFHTRNSPKTMAEIFTLIEQGFLHSILSEGGLILPSSKKPSSGWGKE